MTGPEYAVLAFIALVLLICTLGFIGSIWGWLADRSEARANRRELVDEKTGGVCEDVLARVAAERDAAAEWARIEEAVDIVRMPLDWPEVRA